MFGSFLFLPCAGVEQRCYHLFPPRGGGGFSFFFYPVRVRDTEATGSDTIVRIDVCTSVTVGSGKLLLAFTIAAQQQRRRRCRGSSGSVARRRSGVDL